MKEIDIDELLEEVKDMDISKMPEQQILVGAKLLPFDKTAREQENEID